MEAFLAIFASSFAPVLGTVMVGLASWAGVEATKYVRTKTKNEAANDAISHICHTVQTTVADLNQTMVPALQKAAADGKLTRADGKTLKTIAFGKVKDQIPTAVEQSARLAVTSVNDLISAKIEQAVGEGKKGRRLED